MTALSIVARNASWPRAHTGKAICVFHSSSCPISLYLATIESEKVSFHQINSKSGKRIRYRKVDEGTGEEVPAEQIVKAYEVGKRQYIEITDEELEAIALESRHN
jgi:DNA end-binding protein Ku